MFPPKRPSAVASILALALVGVVVWVITVRFELNLFPTITGSTSFVSTGPRVTTLEPTYFECHVYSKTAFIQQGFKAEDVTRVGVGDIGFNLGHLNALAAFLGVVGEFELCVLPEDQSVQQIDDELMVSVGDIQINRPALDHGEPNPQQVPDCTEVLNDDGSLDPELINTHPATYRQTHYLCVSTGFLAQTDTYTTFLQALTRHAEVNVARSRCLIDGVSAIKSIVERHYVDMAEGMGLTPRIDIDGLAISSQSVPFIPQVEGMEFDLTSPEVCLAG